MKLTDANFVKGFIRMCDDGWQQGWHERNGGNLTYRMMEAEVAEVAGCLDRTGEWKPIGTEVPGLAG